MKSKILGLSILFSIFFTLQSCTDSDDDNASSTRDIAIESPGDYTGLFRIVYSQYPNRNTTDNITVSVEYLSSRSLFIDSQGGDYFAVSLEGSDPSNPSFDEISSANGIYSNSGEIEGSTSIGTSLASITYEIVQPYSQGGTMTISFNGTYEIEE